MININQFITISTLTTYALCQTTTSGKVIGIGIGTLIIIIAIIFSIVWCLACRSSSKP